MRSFSLFILLCLPLSAQQQEAEALDPAAARELIRQWVQTERLISEEKTSWQVEKERMQALLDLHLKELKLLDEEISQAGASAELVDERKESYQKEVKQFRDAQRVLSDRLARLLPRVRTLVSRLPEPLLQKLDAEVEVLQAGDALEKPRDVLKAMLAVMAESGRFNRSVTVVEETREHSSGKQLSVDVIYLGLARAFYAAGQGSAAGVGRPGKQGWQWQERPDLAEDIRKALAVERKDSPPQLIQLPIQLSDETSSK